MDESASMKLADSILGSGRRDVTVHDGANFGGLWPVGADAVVKALLHAAWSLGLPHCFATV